MRILLIGGSGQVGFELARTLPALGQMFMPTSQEIDLARPESIREAIGSSSPDLIVNAAAYTAVDRAEREPDLAFQINADAPRILAEEARSRNALLVTYSTDYVFDGRSQTPYAEDAPCNPLNVYGRSKYAGEQAVQQSGAMHLILRTSWVYSQRRSNFFLTVLRLAAAGKPLKIVNDQTGAPTWSRMIAEATAQLLAACFADPGVTFQDALAHFRPHSGIYNMTAAGSTTWYEFARTICSGFGNPVSVIPIPSAEFASPATRPQYSVLSGTKLLSTFGVALPDWKDSLQQLMREQQLSEKR